MMKSLALFDVDGTLLESNGFDAECYLEAVRLVLGVERVDRDWSHYRNVTDAGILAEIYRRSFRREISPARAREVRRVFVRTVKNRLRAEEIKLKPLPGAAAALRALEGSEQWAVAVATGGWRESAEVKLRNAGRLAEKIPMFSADDSISRPEIIEIAVRKMRKVAKVKSFARVVYIGDGVWDVRAARETKVAFLGVGSKTARLRREGADRVIRDYSDLKKFLRVLETASVPRKKEAMSNEQRVDSLKA